MADPTKRHQRLHDRWMDDPEYAEGYERAAREIALTDALVRAVESVRDYRGATKQSLADGTGRKGAAVRRLLSADGGANPEARLLLALLDELDVQITIDVNESQRPHDERPPVSERLVIRYPDDAQEPAPA